MERENLQNFCNALISYGLKIEDVFSVDAYDEFTLYLYYIASSHQIF
jgi:hypothetical protein